MFKNEIKYFIEVNGELLTIREFSERYDLNPHTVRARYMRGIRDWRELISPSAKAGRPGDPVALDETPDYSLSELWELYKDFATQENEKRMLADFAGVTEKDVAPVLAMFRRRWYKEGYAR